MLWLSYCKVVWNKTCADRCFVRAHLAVSCKQEIHWGHTQMATSFLVIQSRTLHRHNRRCHHHTISILFVISSDCRCQLIAFIPWIYTPLIQSDLNFQHSGSWRDGLYHSWSPRKLSYVTSEARNRASIRESRQLIPIGAWVIVSRVSLAPNYHRKTWLLSRIQRWRPLGGKIYAGEKAWLALIQDEGIAHDPRGGIGNEIKRGTEEAEAERIDMRGNSPRLPAPNMKLHLSLSATQ